MKGVKYKWCVLFFTRNKLLECVLACARAIARIKWRRRRHAVLGIYSYEIKQGENLAFGNFVIFYDFRGKLRKWFLRSEKYQIVEIGYRGGSRTTATSKLEHFVMIVNSWFAAGLDPPLGYSFSVHASCFLIRPFNQTTSPLKGQKVETNIFAILTNATHVGWYILCNFYPFQAR